MKAIRNVVLAGPVLLALALGACDDGGGDNCTSNPTGADCRPSPSPSPTSASEQIVFGDSGQLPANTVGYVEFNIPGPGTLEATVDWTFAESEVFVTMTTNACDDFEAAFLSPCSQIGTPNLGRAKPKTVSGAVTATGTGRLWVANTALVDESVAIQIVYRRTPGTSEPVIVRLSGLRVVAARPSAAILRLRE